MNKAILKSFIGRWMVAPVIGISAAPVAAQVVADFMMPDTVCLNAPVSIQNTSQNATTCYWNFCGGAINSTPTGQNIGSLTGSSFNGPVRVEMAEDNGNYYLFVSNHWNATLSRISYGTNFLGSPVNAQNLGSMGLAQRGEGIQVKKDGNNWYGFMVGGLGTASTLLRIDFGASLANLPMATDLGNIGNMNFCHGFTIFKDGGKWYGFAINASSNSLTRLEFGTSLANTPTGTNLGAIAGISYGTGIAIAQEDGQWWGFVTGRSSNAIVRLNFGNSILNTPTTQVLVSSVLSSPFDIKIVRDCSKTFALVTNSGGSFMARVDFTGGLGGTATVTSLGNIAGLGSCEGISRLVRSGDNAYFWIANVGNSISRIALSTCLTGGISSSALFTPPVYSYANPGNYPVSLFVDEGLPTQDNQCKNIAVTTDWGGGMIEALLDTVCPKQAPVLTASGFAGNVQWQSSVTGTGFANLTGLTGSVCLDIPEQTLYYRAVGIGSSCSDTSAPIKIIVLPEPTSDFTFSVSDFDVAFDSDNSSDDVLAYDWDFGDGIHSGMANTVHSYLYPGTYLACLTVYNESECSDIACKQVVIDFATGEAEAIQMSKWSIHPNPARDKIYIQSGFEGAYHVSLLNLLGEEIISTDALGNTSIPVETLASGTYVVQLHSRENSTQRKVVVIH